jgi:hypothetical protein
MIVLLACILAAGAQTPGIANTSSRRFLVRGAYGTGTSGGDLSYKLAKRDHFTLVNTSSDPTEIQAAVSLKLEPLAWIGGYDNRSCRFDVSDRQVAKLIRSATNAALSGITWYLADEPDARACPNAPGQLSSRTLLVQGVDPTAKTFVALQDGDPYASYVLSGKQATTILAVDIYPCNYDDQACTLQDIGQAARQVNIAGWTDWWGIAQAFGESGPGRYYRMPTKAELIDQWNAWAATSAQGLMWYTMGTGESPNCSKVAVCPSTITALNGQ